MAGRSKQLTEMLKGTLEGIVLAILEKQPAYGYGARFPGVASRVRSAKVVRASSMCI